MPIYQYLCPSCNHKFELRQNFSDSSHVHCPKCKNGAKRLSDIQDTPKEKKETTSPVKETRETIAKETKEAPKAEAKKDSTTAKPS
jgi:putative FmdB family regulatory protein